MKKNLVITILAITSILTTVYGYYQKTQADKFEGLAIQGEKIAREMSVKAEQAMRMAEEQRHLAEANAMQAMQQVQLAQEALKKKK